MVVGCGEARRGVRCSRLLAGAGACAGAGADQGRHRHRPERSTGRRWQSGAGRAAHVGRRRQRARRAARPQGGADRLRRPVESRNHPQHLREAPRHRQGRSADRAVRHRTHRADHAAGEAAQPAADGQLPVPGESQGPARHVLQQRAVEHRGELVGRVLQARPGGRGQDGGIPQRRPGVRAEPGRGRERDRAQARTEDRLRAELPADHGGFLLDHPGDPRRQARHRVRHVLPERLGGHRALGERDRRGRVGEAVRRRHGRPAVRLDHGVARLQAERHRELQHLRAGEEHGVPRRKGFPDALREQGH